jgi:hypothetical protein
MKLSNRCRLSHVVSFAVLVTGMAWLSGCVPLETVQRPSLHEVRSGVARGQAAEDTRLLPGEIPGEVDVIDRARREIRVIADDGRPSMLRYDLDRTRVTYHGWDYAVGDLEAGDRIAYPSAPRSSAYVETIRVLEPVQARSGPSVARPGPARSRPDIIEGTVDRVDHSLGVFDIRPRTGRTVTVSVPYNARTADVDSFRSLRRGDPVRVEGEFVSPDSFQLLAFLSSR